MAFLLGDPKLIAEAKLWLEPSIVGQRENGYFGTEALAGDGKNSPDPMPHRNMLYAYRSYYDATGDKRVLNLMTRIFHWELSLDDKRFVNGGWGAARNSDNMDMFYWLYNRTGDLKWMDRCENVAYNTLPATLTADSRGLRYLTSPNQSNSDARGKAPKGAALVGGAGGHCPE
jgi:DUF1680 family protein